MFLSGYTTLMYGNKFNFPYKQCIRSMLACCDEVVVLVTLDNNEDKDGTLSCVQEMSKVDNRIKIFTQNWDRIEPLQDGLNKAKARSYCSGDYYLQLDADEVLHEKDNEFYKHIHELYPDNILIGVGGLDFFDSKTDIIYGGVANCKARISKNVSWLTHGLPKQFQGINERTNKVCCPSMLSDGAGYIDKETGEAYDADLWIINPKIEELRLLAKEGDLESLKEYSNLILESIKSLPFVYHYSCYSLFRKSLLKFQLWDSLWNLLQGTLDEIPIIDYIDINRIKEEINYKKQNIKYAELYNIQHPIIMDEYFNSDMNIGL